MPKLAGYGGHCGIHHFLEAEISRDQQDRQAAQRQQA